MMSDIFQTVDETTLTYVILAAVAIILLAVIIFNLRNIKNTWLDIKTRYRLNRLGYKQRRNIQWPDGLGHYFTVDRMILRHDGITLLAYKRYPGKIFCADNIEDWTQMLGQKSYRFKNPLVELDFQIKAISAQIPDIAVDGVLFFDHTAKFPKGHPDRVIYLDNLPEKLKSNNKQEVAAPLMSAWERLQSISSL